MMPEVKEKLRHHPLASRNGPLIAFVLLALAGGWAISDSDNNSADRLYQSQLRVCHYNNTVAAEVNRRVHSDIAVEFALSAFLASAEAARRSAGAPEDIKAADEYATLRARLENVHYATVPKVNCKETVQKP